MGKNGRKSCRRWLLPAALVLAGAAWFENFTLSSSTVEVRSAALPAAFSGLRGGQHGAVVDCTEGVLAARLCHGGAQRDVDIVHRRQRRQRRKINGMHHHIPCEGSRRPAPRCMQDVDGCAVKAGCAWGVFSG